MPREFFVYILTNPTNNVLYTGVTSDLVERIRQHKSKQIDGFTKRYNVTRLVYYERYDLAKEAIAREKQIKGGSRKDKFMLINQVNAEWRDLFEDFV